MSIITISRGSYSRGKEIAEKVAEKLGYECISRDILLQASQEFHIPEIKLVEAIHDSPNILNRLGQSKQKYIAYIQSALLKYFKKDNIVYHGLAGHFFVKDVSHILKVRVLADKKDRIRLEMERKGLTEKEADHILTRDDEERKKWSLYLYGIDTSDPSLYDMVLHIHKLNADDAVEIICRAIELERFKTTAESQKAIEDFALAAEIRIALMKIQTDVRVRVENHTAHVETSGALAAELKITAEVEDTVRTFPGIDEVKILVRPIVPLTE